MTILVALGSNLPAAAHASPLDTLRAAIARLPAHGVAVERQSRFYTSPAWPPSDQPDYVNAVVAVTTDLPPAALLAALLRIEREFGRQRSVPNAARTLDLDLIAYDHLVVNTPDRSLQLPHPRAAARPFVLLPLRDVAPDWRHPVTGRTVAELLAGLDLAGTHSLEV
ncbi:2-amino-4-hydroxy-6-hydroxymethyldihydropteridine diphosphokinase [Desertibaculum subflavum]|uniref:2-amino-4-hydroxy-6- hydroxymethyldihydropteridine diphosphokinase n=1 Tax=Desertibaculum subflavum TaxID=2268458 RepID=UPI000E66336C